MFFPTNHRQRLTHNAVKELRREGLLNAHAGFLRVKVGKLVYRLDFENIRDEIVVQRGRRYWRTLVHYQYVARLVLPNV